MDFESKTGALLLMSSAAVPSKSGGLVATEEVWAAVTTLRLPHPVPLHKDMAPRPAPEGSEAEEEALEEEDSVVASVVEEAVADLEATAVVSVEEEAVMVVTEVALAVTEVASVAAGGVLDISPMAPPKALHLVLVVVAEAGSVETEVEIAVATAAAAVVVADPTAARRTLAQMAMEAAQDMVTGPHAISVAGAAIATQDLEVTATATEKTANARTTEAATTNHANKGGIERSLHDAMGLLHGIPSFTLLRSLSCPPFLAKGKHSSGDSILRPTQLVRR